MTVFVYCVLYRLFYFFMLSASVHAALYILYLFIGWCNYQIRRQLATRYRWIRQLQDRHRWWCWERRWWHRRARWAQTSARTWRRRPQSASAAASPRCRTPGSCSTGRDARRRRTLSRVQCTTATTKHGQFHTHHRRVFHRSFRGTEYPSYRFTICCNWLLTIIIILNLLLFIIIMIIIIISIFVKRHEVITSEALAAVGCVC